MLPAFSLRSRLHWAIVLGACVAASCSEKGVTSSCPPLPFYQTYPLGDASPPDAASADSPATIAALARAVDAGCSTERTLFPYDASAGAAGDDAVGGSSGHGPMAGTGGSAGHNAGTAGAN